VVALLGVLIALIVGFLVVNPFGTRSTTGAAGAANNRGPSGKGTDAGVPDVRLDLLQHEEAEYHNPVRNPFRFEQRTRPGAAPSGNRPRVRPVVEPPPEPVGPPPVPPPPPIPLRYIGFIEPKTGPGRIAVLSDGRGTVIDGKEGDVIEGRYRLLRVGNDSADLVYLDGRGRQTIRLSGQ
jgi:hypothetical protein